MDSTAPPRGGAKRTRDPDCSFTLHPRQGIDVAFALGTVEEPQTQSVCRDGHNTGAVEEAALFRRQASCRVPQHAHGHHSGQRLG